MKASSDQTIWLIILLMLKKADDFINQYNLE